MIRKLALALSLLAISFSSALYALGLGEVKVSSSLNQPLNAEIEILNTKGLTAEEVLPGLATREEFLRAGVDRVYFLSDLRFKVEQNASGAMVVKLTTNKPVREPFLNFLVEVIWPSGRLLREYALLIDPPVFAEEPPQVVAPAPVSRPQSGDRLSLPTPESTTAQASSAPTQRSLLAAAPAATGTYGPTNSRDTLWDIALKARPDRSVSPQQVMLAIQDLNPGAFIDGNINKLKAGQVLRLPTKEQIQARSLSGAINEVIAQNEALNPRKKVVSAAKKTKPKSAPQAAAKKSEDQLKLVVANDATTNSASADSADETVAGSGKGDDDRLALALERLDKSSLENEELSGKVQDLESQLETLQRLLTLKNDQLSSLQAQARQNELEQAQAEQEKLDEQKAPAAEDQQVAASEEPVPSEVPATEEVAAADSDLSEDKSIADAESAVQEVAEEIAEPTVAPKPVASTAVEPAQRKPVSSTEGIFELILGNPLYQALVIGGLFVLLIILWLVSKSNARKEAEAYDSTETDHSAFGATEVDDYDDTPFDGEGDSFEESDEFESEDNFDSSDEAYEQSDASDEAEAAAETEDVIGEADVYIAYGRLDQAAAILLDGIEKDPVRTDYRLKLLEVYADTGEVSAFDQQLSELEAIQDPDAVARALEIKAGMAAPAQEEELEDDLLSDAAQEEALEEEVSESLDNSFDFESVENELEEDDLGVDLESDELDVDLDIDLNPEENADSAEDKGIDFEKVELAEEAVEESLDAELDAVLEEGSDTEDGLDFNAESVTDSGAEEPVALDDELSDELSEELSEELLAEGDLDAALETEAEEESSDDDLEDALELELELSDDLETEAEIDLGDDLAIPDELLDLDSGDNAEATEDAVAELAEDTSDKVVSDDILDEASEALAESNESDAELEPDEDFDFLDGTDEASTKLDLARAYIDMGDVEGARDILLEVEKEGNDEQKADARSLIDSLD